MVPVLVDAEMMFIPMRYHSAAASRVAAPASCQTYWPSLDRSLASNACSAHASAEERSIASA
jgi:hypothetical protein